MATTHLRRESLKLLQRDAVKAFPEYKQQIDDYILEIQQLIEPEPDSASKPAPSADNAIKLLCKLEDYLESIMVGTLAKNAGR